MSIYYVLSSYFIHSFFILFYNILICCFFFFLMIRRPPRSTQSRSSAASDVYKRQALSAGNEPTMPALHCAMTKSGFEIMKSGEPMTGIRNLESCWGIAMSANPDWCHCYLFEVTVG
eukprot:TRINITY_DN29146_c0_g1_i1.p1 TRINITY_DN29146_c0_g1~~TRINITY_DN29146_c0_g1_i1.p1  ORF type:complete len:117 (+),score=25.41 TRINITY_DN29146_c0_g1_i1:41-391(+)